jgi:transcriptional regulator with XRE-family HTH domain
MTLQVTPRLSQRSRRFPNRIREYRLRAGLTQGALADLLEKNRKVVSAWELGLCFPTGPVLLKLAKALNTLAESLYQDIYSTFHPSDRKGPRV